MLAEVSIPTWAAWTGGVTAACTMLLAVVTVGRTVVRPFIKFAATLDETLPVMVEIAHNYADTSGRGEVLTAELSTLATGQGAIAETQRQTVAKLEQVIAKLNDLHDYSHRMRHDIIGDVGKLGLAIGTTATIADVLSRTAEQLQSINEALDRLDIGPAE